MAADLAADYDIFGHVGLYDDGVRAELPGLEHGHGRTHAGLAGNVAAGGDHPALATTDDQRLVEQAWVVALFDRGIECVAVDMRDGEFEEFLVCDDAR